MNDKQGYMVLDLLIAHGFTLDKSMAWFTNPNGLFLRLLDTFERFDGIVPSPTLISVRIGEQECFGESGKAHEPIRHLLAAKRSLCNNAGERYESQLS